MTVTDLFLDSTKHDVTNGLAAAETLGGSGWQTNALAGVAAEKMLE
jgi:hypothetical protein